MVEDLKFSSPKRAEKVFENYNENQKTIINKNFQLTPIESLKQKEIELNMLEEGYRTRHRLQAKVFKNLDPQLKSDIGNDLKV